MTDTKFMSAKEKDQVLRAWQRFLKGGCKFSQFTKALYSHLTQHCSFIAHYNRNGFWYDYFYNEPVREKFFTQFDRDLGCISIEYGGDYWLKSEAYADLNNKMVDSYMNFKNDQILKTAIFGKGF
jgi:hypothetical protein